MDVARTYADAFKQELADNGLLKEALDSVLQSAQGPVFVTGSALYGGIVRRLYNRGGIPLTDFDFVVATYEDWDRIKPANGWMKGHIGPFEKEYNGGVKRFTKAHAQMDVSSLSKYDPPHIETLLSETPLNVQSLAFDAREGIIIGEVGQRAIREQVVTVHGIADAGYYADMKGMTVEELVQKKAKQLGFTPRL